MPDLVSLDQARQHLRLDSDSAGGSDDAWLETWIPAVSESIALWLKDSFRLYLWQLDSNGDTILDSSGEPELQLDGDGEPIIRPIVRAACLVELASQYRFREGEGDNAVTPDAGHGYMLNKASTALLSGLRKTTIS